MTVDMVDLAKERTLPPAPGGTGRQEPRALAIGRQLALTGISVLIIAGLWEFLSRLDPPFWPKIILSQPTDVSVAFWEAVQTPFVWANFWVTFQETILGFFIGSAIGLILGVGIALLRTVRQAVYPIVVLFQATPRIALAPVFIAWFGFGMTSKVALAITICFFPVLVNTITGLSLAEESSVLLMRALRARRYQVFFYLRLPTALPTIFAGLKAALTFAVIGAIVGELGATNEGAGHLIERAAFQLRMDDVFAYLLMLALLGLALFLIASGLERRLIFWHSDWEQEE